MSEHSITEHKGRSLSWQMVNGTIELSLHREPCNEIGSLVLEELEHARERDATKSFGMFSCSKATNEMNYAAQKFTRAVMGSNNIDSCNRT